MKILFIGDIYARPGRELVKKLLPGIKKKLKPDLVLANPENLTHGNGFSYDHILEMRDAGIDFFTSGNHVWENKSGVDHLNDPDFPVLRPANYPPGAPGRGYDFVKVKGEKVLVISLIGQVFMKGHFDCPLRTADKILQETKKEKPSVIFIDLHAEATSEKYALAYYLDGRISALVGTHTHVQTNDARILEKGTAYISDVGMTGPFDSVIGVKKEIIVHQFLTQLPVKHEPATEGKMAFSAVSIGIDDKTGKALNIKSILEFD